MNTFTAEPPATPDTDHVADTATVMFDIQRYVSVDDHAPTLAEARDMYERWLDVPRAAIGALRAARSARNTLEIKNS